MHFVSRSRSTSQESERRCSRSSGANTIKEWLVPLGAAVLMGELAMCVQVASPIVPDPKSTAFRPELMLQSGHSGHVTSLAVGRDGRFVASGSIDRTARLWEVATGRMVRGFSDDTEAVSTVAFSPDGSLLATAGRNIKVWEVRTGRVLHTFTVPDNTNAVAFSPDGTRLASGGWDETVRLWDITSERLLHAFSGGIGWVNSVAFSPNGRYVASARAIVAGGVVDVWDADTATKLFSLSGHTGGVDSVAFSSDGNFLASGSADKTVKLWNLATREVVRTFSGHTAGVDSVALSPDGRMLASGSTDYTAKLWDIATGAELHSLASHTWTVTAVAFSPDGRTLYTGSWDNNIKLWNVSTGRELRTLRGHMEEATCLGISSDGHWLASGGYRNTTKLWDLMAGLEVRTLSGHTGAVLALAFSPDGHLIATGSSDKTVKLWEVATGREVLTFSGHAQAVLSVAFSSDGRTIASGSDDLTIKLWDVATGRALHTSSDHGWPAYSVAFSRDGRWLASARGGNVVLYDVASGSIARTFVGHTDFVFAVTFSPDGRILASGSLDDTARLWELATGRELRTLVGHTGTVGTLSFSPDGHWLASGSWDHTARLWDVATGQQVRSLPAQPAFISGVRFSADGRWLATASHDGSVRLLDPKNGDLLASLVSAGDDGSWLVTTPNGLFDGSTAGWNQILWRFNSSHTFDIAPVEVYFREYYLPRLLQRILTRGVLPEVRPLASLNRTQPRATIVSVIPELAKPEMAVVTLETVSLKSEVQNDAKGHFLESGVYDVRLFRDGKIVGQWPDLPVGAAEKVGPIVTAEDREAWRKRHRVKLDASGKAMVTFHNIRLPQRVGVEKVAFTAYAFNADRVKSVTTPPFEYTLPSGVAAGASRRAYLVTMGVNANQSHNLDLELAVSSAERVRGLLHRKLHGDYSEVVEVPLYSDLAEDSNQVRQKTASKAGLRAVLDLLAGRSVDPRLRDEVDPKHQLRAAGPDDAVVLYVASHGYADPQGTFYLMPYDTGSNWGVTEDVLTRCQTSPDRSAACKQAEDLLAHSVSSADLTAWWSGVDAGEMVMILDSCHSGAVPGKDFRPGPLGDPGFGQLSYDKGMQILTASQPAQTAQGEWVTGGEGRTLLEDALEAVAQANPQATVQQWLHDAEQQLPVIAKQLYPALKEEDVQLPVLLDFARKTNVTLLDAQ